MISRLRRRFRYAIWRWLSARNAYWIEFRFDCPWCGEPWAALKERLVDIHGGHGYTCNDCGKVVVFEIRRRGRANGV